MIKPIVNLSKVAEDFNTFIFGFNGVLYDGKSVLPEVSACLRNLNAIGKKIVIISNTALRIEEVVEMCKLMEALAQDFDISYVNIFDIVSSSSQ